jgi:hypothetical protein
VIQVLLTCPFTIIIGLRRRMIVKLRVQMAAVDERMRQIG